jgi:putative flavoprotein involved in K+ transport
MNLPSRVGTVVIGAGHAGLTMSWFLRRAGEEHLVLDRATDPGGSWRDRWDSFRLVTPNWAASFPEEPYDGSDPDGFMSRDEIDARVAAYAHHISAPLATETDALRLTTNGGRGRFRLETTQGDLEADEVVVATGSFHTPRIPSVATELPSRIHQLHSHAYRNERGLVPGGVLIVGSGQSGCQIAEELLDGGRRVFLSVGSAGQAPRRYRGSDLFRWLAALATQGGDVGVGLPTVDQLPDLRMRSAANPQLSGHGGGHDVNLRRMAMDGIVLIGRISRVRGRRLEFAPGLSASLARADAFFDERFRPLIDRFIETAGIDAPADDREPLAYEPPERPVLDLDAEGISNVIWATGYDLDYTWIDLPILDGYGFPQQRRGVSDVPGLYFLGLLWQHTQASATLLGPMLDAPHLVAHLKSGVTR